MRGVWKGYLAILLVGIFVMTPMSIIVQNNESTIVLTEQSEARMAVAGDSSIIDLTSNPSVGLGFTIDVPQDEPITQIEMEIKPSPLETRDGLAWEGASAWNHPDSTSSGVGLTLMVCLLHKVVEPNGILIQAMMVGHSVIPILEEYYACMWI